MWPSPETADRLFALSNVLLILSLSLTVVATIGVVWMANVREGYLKRDLSEANTRIAEANAAGEAARLAAAEANKRAAEAALELERFKAPRTLPNEQQQHVASRVRQFVGQEYTAVLVPGSFDAPILWTDLDKALTSAGWSRMPPAGLATGQPPAGVALVPASGSIIAIDRSRPTGVMSAASALIQALNSVGLDAKAGLTQDPKEKRPNIITIRIGLKPQ
jgi:hypothetical protein